MGVGSYLSHEIELTLPHLPAELEGWRIAHLSDLHVKRRRPRHRHIQAEVAALRADVALFTGDYMDHPGDEDAALGVLRDLLGALPKDIPALGIFGNHDSQALRRAAQSLPVHWLAPGVVTLPNHPVQILGLNTDRHTSPDAMPIVQALYGAPHGDAAAGLIPPPGGRIGGGPTAPGATGGLSASASTNGVGTGNQLPVIPPVASGDPSPPPSLPQGGGVTTRPLRLLMSHYPLYLVAAADLGIDLVFSGHTHGGQWRLPGVGALYNSCDLPLALSSGVLRYRDTLGLVSRGLGETFMELRLFCPPHLPVYTLRRGPLPAMSEKKFAQIGNVQPW